MTPEERMQEQDYEPDTPRCFTCVYFKRVAVQPELKTVIRMLKKTRNGPRKPVKVQVRPKPNRVNPRIETCTFGNFEVKPGGVCREWHGRDGAKLLEAIPMKLVERTYQPRPLSEVDWLGTAASI